MKEKRRARVNVNVCAKERGTKTVSRRIGARCRDLLNQALDVTLVVDVRLGHPRREGQQIAPSVVAGREHVGADGFSHRVLFRVQPDQRPRRFS